MQQKLSGAVRLPNIAPGPNTVVPADDRYYIKLPKDSNTFAWNNEGYLHGADYHSPHRKILAVIKGLG